MLKERRKKAIENNPVIRWEYSIFTKYRGRFNVTLPVYNIKLALGHADVAEREIRRIVIKPITIED